MFQFNCVAHRAVSTTVPHVGWNLGERLRKANSKFDVGHGGKFSTATLCPKSFEIHPNFNCAWPAGADPAPAEGISGRQPSNRIWSAQRAASLRSTSLRTVQVSNGKPNIVRASNGGIAGKSLTE